MSQSASYRYQLERKQQRKLYLDRIRENTKRFYDRFRSMYEKMLEDGLAEYVPEELSKVESYLSAIRANVDDNPESAKSKSLQLGKMITEARTLGYETKKEIAAKQKERRKELRLQSKQAQSTIITFLNEQIESFTDPVVRDFAYEDIRMLTKEVSELRISAERVKEVKADIHTRMAQIKKKAHGDAKEWRANKKDKLRSQSQRELVRIYKDHVEANKQENPQLVEQILSSLNRTEDRFLKGEQVDSLELEKSMVEHCEQVDAAVMDERIRKETVRVVIKSLQAAGFEILADPRKIVEEGTDYVKILAKKPSGKSAVCKIDLTGELYYKFDRYEGMTCLKDSETFKAKLQEIYGVELSDERVLWQNPVPEDREVKDLPVESRQRRS